MNTQEYIEQQTSSNQELIHFVIKKYFPFIFNTYEYDDYFQEGFIGLYTAAKYYDKNKGQFSTYATVLIKNAISSKLKLVENKMKQRTINKNVISINLEIDTDLLLEDMLASPLNIERQVIEKAEREYKIKQIYKFLSNKQKKVFKCILQLKTPKEMAAELKCTRNNIYQTIDFILKKVEVMQINNFS